MKSINFKNHFKEYAVNGGKSKAIRVKLSPDMPDKIESIRAEIDKISAEINEGNFAETGRKYGEIINNAFGTDICATALDGENPFSLADGGKFLIEAFFEAFTPVFTADLEALKIRPEVQKYLETS